MAEAETGLGLSCIVLAGGKGQRLGYDKIQECIGGISLIKRVVDTLSSFRCQIIIVTARKQVLPGVSSYPETKRVTDIYPGKGPLGGVYTGLVVSEHLQNIVVAADMPFLNLPLLKYMVGKSAGFDVVIPRIGRMIEPLHAVYSKECLPLMELKLAKGELSIHSLFTRLRVNYIEADDIDRFDPDHLSFFNINTEAELKKARELARRRKRAMPGNIQE